MRDFPVVRSLGVTEKSHRGSDAERGRERERIEYEKKDRDNERRKHERQERGKMRNQTGKRGGVKRSCEEVSRSNREVRLRS